MHSRSIIRGFIRSKFFMLLVLLIVIIGFLAIYSGGTFIRLRNIMNILNMMVAVTLLTIGAGCLIISGKLDLSTGAVGTMAGVCLAVLIQGGMHWSLSLLISLSLGVVTGLFNAMLINEFRFQPFIATMSVASVARGLTFVISSAPSTPMRDPVLSYLGGGRIGGLVPISVIISLCGLLIYGLMLNKTKFGRNIYLVGGNPNAAMLAGVNPKKISYILFVNSGVLGAFAGCLLAGSLKSATVTALNASQFAGVTAAILGGISFGGGSGGMGGAFLGLLILNGFTNGMTILGVGPYWQLVASGVLLLLALSMDYFNIRSLNKRVGVGV